MEWQDDGIILRTQPFQDNSLIVTLLTRHQGKHAGLIRISKRNLGNPLQPGTRVAAHWQARLVQHLGAYKLDIQEVIGQRWFHKPQHLQLLQISCALLDSALAEHDTCPQIYADFLQFLSDIDNSLNVLQTYVLFEYQLLHHLGFGLNLNLCAATGNTHNLTYVSPKSGQAVSQDAGKPYHDRLLLLPAFFSDTSLSATQTDIQNGLDLTGHFLEKHLYGNKRPPFFSMRQLLTKRSLTA